MGDKSANHEALTARIAARQHGVLSIAQLVGPGLGRQGIHYRAKIGRLHRIHRGVYAVGHTDLGFQGRCMAAVLALGGSAAVSHRSAAALWGMLEPHSGPVEITVSKDGGRRQRDGIAIHRSRTLVAPLITRRHGIAVTNPSRTLQDVRRTLPQPVFRRALRRALDLRLIGSAGISESDLTRSELERRFLNLCRRHRIPRPEVNSRVGSYEVDFLWPERRLVVEVDGFRNHGHRSAFEADREKDARLQSRGFRVLRFTYRQIADRREVVRALRSLLGPVPLFE